MSEELPDDVVLVCEYDLNVLVDCIDEAAFFRRSDGTDELWLRNELYVKRQVSAPTADDPAAAALRLLERSIRGTWGAQYPTRCLRPGLVTEAALMEIVATITARYESNAEAAALVPSRLVEVARELGLCPEPTGTGKTHWQANCPGTNHPLYIEAAAESFGCGYCRRKGGEAELRAFVAERARPRRG
jgi:hypothetical protein